MALSTNSSDSRDRPSLGARPGLGSLPPGTSVKPGLSTVGNDSLKRILNHPGLAPSQEREFAFTDADFERIRSLLYKNAGIVLSPSKQDMVYSRLVRRLRSCGDQTFSQYLRRLEQDNSERETFINSLTTNLTSFFREAHHFEILADQLKQVKEKRPIRIWCCASSTGEEPYSLAITVCDTFSSMTPPVEIVASDIDTSVLAQAEKGIYRRDRLDRVQPTHLSRYFTPIPGGDGSYAVRAELHRLIRFRRINLLSPAWPVQGPFDAIFCRNVMIYFDKQTQYSVLKRFVPLLRQDGRIYAGHSESFIHAADLLRSVGRTVYVRLDSPLR
ncbi:MAG: chemotaxis protein CheR [Proteobacteria bacterium]|nr:chemotaxis protein CheR [Pseudomonadota bacterium]